MKKALLKNKSKGEIDVRECKKEEEHIRNDDMVEMVSYSGEKLRVKSSTHSYIVHLII